MILEKRLTAVLDAYREQDVLAKGTKINDGRIFVPTSLQEAMTLLTIGAKSGFYPNRGYFLDAGSGDGRMVALLSCLGYKAIGVEFDLELAVYSQGKLEQLKRQGAITADAKIAKGDFTDAGTYQKMGVDFQDIRNIFHGINLVSLRGLVEKIKNESPSGTTLTLYGPFGMFPEFEGLAKVSGPHRLGYVADVAYYQKCRVMNGRRLETAAQQVTAVR